MLMFVNSQVRSLRSYLKIDTKLDRSIHVYMNLYSKLRKEKLHKIKKRWS